MAELLAALGAISAVGTIASEGTKLSREINDYIRKARSADKDIKLIAHDVESTAMLLQQFEKNLRMEQETRVCSAEFYSMTDQSVYDCRAVFKDIRASLPSVIFLERQPEDEDFKMKGREKIWWPFKHDKIAPLRANIDRLKIHLNSMLLVMRHARDLHERQLADQEKSFEIELELKTLELRKQDVERKFHALRGGAVETYVSAQWPRENRWEREKRGSKLKDVSSVYDRWGTNNNHATKSQFNKLPFSREPRNHYEHDSADLGNSADEAEWMAKERPDLVPSTSHKKSPLVDTEPADDDGLSEQAELSEVNRPEASLAQGVPSSILLKLEASLSRIAAAQEKINSTIKANSRSRAATTTSEGRSSGRFSKRTTLFEEDLQSSNEGSSEASNIQAIDTHSDSGISGAEGHIPQDESPLPSELPDPLNEFRKSKQSRVGFIFDSGNTSMVQGTSVPYSSHPPAPLSLPYSRSLTLLPVSNQIVEPISEARPRPKEGHFEQNIEGVALKRLLLGPPTIGPERRLNVNTSTMKQAILQKRVQGLQLAKLKQPIDVSPPPSVIDSDHDENVNVGLTNGELTSKAGSKARIRTPAISSELLNGEHTPRQLQASGAADPEREDSSRGESSVRKDTSSGGKTPNSINVEAGSELRRTNSEEEESSSESKQSDSEAEGLGRPAGSRTGIEEPLALSSNLDKSPESKKIASWLSRIPGSKKFARLVNRDQGPDVEGDFKPQRDNRDLKARVDSESDESLVPVKNAQEAPLEPVKKTAPTEQTPAPKPVAEGSIALPPPPKLVEAKPIGTEPIQAPPPPNPMGTGPMPIPPPPKPALKPPLPPEPSDYNSGVINLDHTYQPNPYARSPWSNNTIQPMLEVWTLRRAPPRKSAPHRTWKRSTRVIVPLKSEEIEKLVKKRSNRKPLWEKYESLSFFQQHQIDRLLRDKRAYDPDPGFEHSLAALETWPKKAPKIDITSIQVVLHRHQRTGGLTMPPSGPFPTFNPVPPQGFAGSNFRPSNAPPPPPPSQQQGYNGLAIPPPSFQDFGASRPHVSFSGQAPRQTPLSDKNSKPAVQIIQDENRFIPEISDHKRRPPPKSSDSRSSSRRRSRDRSSTSSSDDPFVASLSDEDSFGDDGSWQPTRHRNSRRSEPRSTMSSATIDIPRRDFSRRVQTISDWDLEEDRLEMEMRLDRLDREVARRSDSKTRPRYRGPSFDARSDAHSRTPRAFERSRPIDGSSMRGGRSDPFDAPEISGPYYGRHGGPLRQSQVPPYAYGKPGQGSLIDDYLAKWTIVKKNPPYDQDGSAEQANDTLRRNPRMSNHVF